MDTVKIDHPDPELAAALLFLLGEPVPHDPKLESDAGKIVEEAGDREKLLLGIAALCGGPETPRKLYLREKAYSRLGKKYCRETVRCASEYLEGEGWSALSRGTEEQDGIEVDSGDARRAGVLLDLAAAQEEAGELEAAYSSYLEAYELAPHNAMVAVKASDVLSRLRGRGEALNFLLEQRRALYYEPVRYRDSLGRVHRNAVFRDLIEAHILKLQDKSSGQQSSKA